MRDNDGPVMTLTKGEIDRARNGSEPSSSRPCEVCGNPLGPTQTRACTPKCRAKLASLASHSRHARKPAPVVRSAPRKHTAPVSGASKRAGDSLGWLDELPADVVRVEWVRDGWRAEFTRS